LLARLLGVETVVGRWRCFIDHWNRACNIKKAVRQNWEGSLSMEALIEFLNPDKYRIMFTLIFFYKLK
jgi:hypothetical protein